MVPILFKLQTNLMQLEPLTDTFNPLYTPEHKPQVPDPTLLHPPTQPHPGPVTPTREQNMIDDMIARTERIEEQDLLGEGKVEKEEELSHNVPASEEELSRLRQQQQEDIRKLQRQWEYRYVCLLDHAIRHNDWFKLFAFLAEFKGKCIELVKTLIHGGLGNAKCIDEIDHRYNLKGENEEGIYLVEGVIIRVGRVKSKRAEGGKKVFNYNATKALHQEFLSNNILNNLAIGLVNDEPQMPRIRVPLSCLVKYMGYTCLCMADSPCEGLETLVHGPTGTIYQYREEYMEMLRVIGSCLNLKQFTMRSSDKKSVPIPFSLTLELHRVKKILPNETLLSIISPDSILYPPNGKIQLDQPCFYLMNIAKLWPLFIDSDIIKSVGYLRPEVVISAKTPLSNVVFCEVSERPDPEGELELADACKRVKEDHISSLARLLDNTTVFLVDSQGIEDLLHEYGVNIRYMGSLAEKVNLDFNKKILEVEMIARACKRYFFTAFHEMADERGLGEGELLAEFKETFVDLLNLIFIRSKAGERFYRERIYKEVQRYYDYRIYAYPPELQGGGILHALCYHFGVRLKIIDYPFFQDLDSIFNTAHILEVHGSARTYDLDTAEVKQICKTYKQKKKLEKLDECIKLLKILSKMHQIMSPERTEPIGPLPESYFWTELAEVYFKMGNDLQAQRYAQMALRGIPEKHSDSIRPFQILLKYHTQRKEINKGVEYYEKSLNYLSYHLGTAHPLTITVYNTFAFEQLEHNDPSKCEKMFLKSLEICERSLGYTHATSSEILLQLAELPLETEKQINYFLQGLNVLENLEGGEAEREKIRRVCMKIAEMYEKVGNLDKMIYFARRSQYWQLQMKGESRQDLHKSVLLLANRNTKDRNECAFLVLYAFRSYIQLLPKVSRQQLYKLFVSLRDQLLSTAQANEMILRRLTPDKLTTLTVTEMIKNTITQLLSELPALIGKSSFYKHIMNAVDPEDKKLIIAIDTYRELIASVGEERTERILTEKSTNLMREV